MKFIVGWVEERNPTIGLLCNKTTLAHLERSGRLENFTAKGAKSAKKGKQKTEIPRRHFEMLASSRHSEEPATRNLLRIGHPALKKTRFLVVALLGMTNTSSIITSQLHSFPAFSICGFFFLT